MKKETPSRLPCPARFSACWSGGLSAVNMGSPPPRLHLRRHPVGSRSRSARHRRPFDAARAADLERQATRGRRTRPCAPTLGNLYFDGERYDQAATWYEASLKLDPNAVEVSTDLAVAYYYTQQADRALAQLDHSLKLDPAHLKTLLNQGIIRAFGKQDLKGAAESWQRVVAIAPTSEEGRRAQQGLDGLKAAHASSPGASGGIAQ